MLGRSAGCACDNASNLTCPETEKAEDCPALFPYPFVGDNARRRCSSVPSMQQTTEIILNNGDKRFCPSANLTDEKKSVYSVFLTNCGKNDAGMWMFQGDRMPIAMDKQYCLSATDTTNGSSVRVSRCLLSNFPNHQTWERKGTHLLLKNTSLCLHLAGSLETANNLLNVQVCENGTSWEWTTPGPCVHAHCDHWYTSERFFLAVSSERSCSSRATDDVAG